MGKKSILIVDDERANINVLYGALSPEYDIIAAKNGEQALKRAETLSPDLILLDIIMPEMDGYEVCYRLKKNETTKNIPVIFLTAMKDTAYETKGLEMGAVDYISKPVSTPIVKIRVKHHLEREEYRNRLEDLVGKRTAELNKAKEELEVANQAKSDFLMTMRHELRTPLNGVLTAADLISACETKEELEGIQKIIRSSGKALLKTIEQILNFTGSKDGKLKLNTAFFRLDEIPAKIQNVFFHKGGRKNIKFIFNVDLNSVPAFLFGDEERLIEIINHLSENAAKFTKAPPEATLTIKVVDKTKETVMLKFSMKDNGIGIAEENHEKIFEPFSQVDASSIRRYDGAGIGLSLCRYLVELMGGEIWVESELGKGSTFHFTARLKYGNEKEGGKVDRPAIKGIDPDHKEIKTVLKKTDVKVLSPVFKKLKKALAGSEPLRIATYVSEIKVYDIPNKNKLFQKIDVFEYDEALSVLENIAADMGVDMESP